MKFHFESLYSNNLTVKAINYFHAGPWKDRKLSEMAQSPLKPRDSQQIIVNDYYIRIPWY